MAEINVAMLVSQTVTEAQAQSRLKMGRDYASFYEAWAVLRQRIEETKRDAKALEKLHSELWDAIKDGNEDEALIEMGAINANAAALCAAFAGMANEKPSPGRGWAKASGSLFLLTPKLGSAFCGFLTVCKICTLQIIRLIWLIVHDHCSEMGVVLVRLIPLSVFKRMCLIGIHKSPLIAFCGRQGS